ncbi:hypothetical protein [Gordonia oryzae]|uniref:hypothetical protein n=1 Tax=Gordonia oryzae TaxID=2487349 RepID=UPI001FE7C326|nr:hypothetical protein [Gordonia oryzae]
MRISESAGACVAVLVRRLSATRQVRGWLPATVVRVALGVLWLGVLWLDEGVLKYRAGFGSVDIGLVGSSTLNPAVPAYFTAFSDHVLSRTTALFGCVMAVLEMARGVVLVLGVLILPIALDPFPVMTYWYADQLMALTRSGRCHRLWSLPSGRDCR